MGCFRTQLASLGARRRLGEESKRPPVARTRTHTHGLQDLQQSPVQEVNKHATFSEDTPAPDLYLQNRSRRNAQTGSIPNLGQLPLPHGAASFLFLLPRTFPDSGKLDREGHLPAHKCPRTSAEDPRKEIGAGTHLSPCWCHTHTPPPGSGTRSLCSICKILPQRHVTNSLLLNTAQRKLGQS